VLTDALRSRPVLAQGRESKPSNIENRLGFSRVKDTRLTVVKKGTGRRKAGTGKKGRYGMTLKARGGELP
jgi:hypothetical protein